MSRSLQPRSRKAAFSLVELLVALLSVSILAMLVGSLLVLGHRSWIDGNRRVDLQRDATLAMEAIGSSVRAARKGAQTVSGDHRQLFCGDGTSVAWVGNQLVLNPGGTVLVRDHVLNFHAEIDTMLAGQPVRIILQLFDPESQGASILTGTFLPRNPAPDA